MAVFVNCFDMQVCHCSCCVVCYAVHTGDVKDQREPEVFRLAVTFVATINKTLALTFVRVINLKGMFFK